MENFKKKVQKLTDKRYFMIVKHVPHSNMSRGDVIELADDDGSEMKLYSILGGSHSEFSLDTRYIQDRDLEEIIGYSELAPVIENDSQPSIRKLKVKSCVFTDANGDTITIKRSPCRHYYLKAPGKKQKRIKKQQLAGILTGLSAAL